MRLKVNRIFSEVKIINTYSNPTDLKITDMRFVDIDGAPKRCTILKIMTNQGITGYGEVRDASSKTYALMLKSRILGENPCNVDRIFRKIKQFGGPSRQGGGVLFIPAHLVADVVEGAANMKKKGCGRIVTIGSVQEAKPYPDMLIYSASKAAQTNMVKSLSLQLAPFGITVNNMAPGVIYTDRNVEALSDPEYAKKVTNSIPVGFYGEPDDCAGTVSLLCSDEGRYITGQSIYVDGGKSVQ